MAFEFKLPDIGEGVAEAEIVKWMVAEGDVVVEDQPLVEVLTDKATVEIPSPRAGRIAKLGAVEGATLPVGSVLVTIEVAGEGAAPPVAAHVPADYEAAVDVAEAAHAGVAPPAAPAARVEAVPAARLLAKESGLDLSTVPGTGPNGRITLDDVKKALEGGEPARVAAPRAHGAEAADERVPLRGLRRRIAEHMVHAARTVPHFTFVAEADMSALVAAREKARLDPRAAGTKVTYLAYIVRAVAAALREFPLLNASLDEATSEIVLKKHYDIGIATATDEGLVVPGDQGRRPARTCSPWRGRSSGWPAGRASASWRSTS